MSDVWTFILTPPSTAFWSPDELFDLNFGDPEGYLEWEEQEEDGDATWEQAEEEFEAYCRYQMKLQENQHEITSFVMGCTFKKSLLLNRMEVDSDADSDPEPEGKMMQKMRWDATSSPVSRSSSPASQKDLIL